MAVALMAMGAMALSASADPAEAQATGDAVVGEAKGWNGTPYDYPDGIDCTGLTSAVYSQFGVSLPDSPSGQMGYGVPVANPGSGDLVFFSEGGDGYISHVGIATGNGTVIHASGYYGYVTETPIAYIPGYVGARSVI
jgi:cell wall-associated NlpC family hydrolase